MSGNDLIKVTLLTLVTISTIYFSIAAEPRAIVDSPVLREVEYKKALFYNRKPVGTTSLKGEPSVRKVTKLRRVTPLKQIDASSSSSKLTHSDESKTGKIVRSSVPGSSEGTSDHSSKNVSSALPTVVVTPAPSNNVSSNEKVSSTSSNNETEQTAASDRLFIPPYKMPFWGLPYGVYSNAGFLNPGLFPFVPGGPGFPPYDGIFGSPFGPGAFPGNMNPFPKGTGTPMDPGPLPLPPMPYATSPTSSAASPPPIPYGQPPLNPTGRRSNGPPPGAFSPGSPMGYYYRKPPRRPPPPPPRKKKKKKPKSDPEPELALDTGAKGCSCSLGLGHDDAPAKPHTTTNAPTPCPCSMSKGSSAPSFSKQVDDFIKHHHHHHDEDHHHQDHHDHDHHDALKPEPLPCPLATLPTTTTTTEYVPPTTTTAASTTTEYVTTSEAPRSKKPCRLKHRATPPPPPPRVYYEYDHLPTQMAAPARKPCPLRSREVEYVPATEEPVSSPQMPIIYQPAAYSPIQGIQTQGYSAQPAIQYQQPQYITATSAPAPPVASVPLEPQMSQTHSTILYKPYPQEVVHTPTSITVPLPFPYVLDSNGAFQPQQSPLQNSQQVTYKVDLNQDLLSKITTPVVVTQPQQQQQQQQPQLQQSQQLLQLLQSHSGQFLQPAQHVAANSNSNSQLIFDGQHLTLANPQPASTQSQLPQSSPQSQFPQSRVLIVDGGSPPLSTINQSVQQQPSISFPSNAFPSPVVVLKSDSVPYQQQNPMQQVIQASPQSPVTVSYVQPNNPSTSLPSFNTVSPIPSDYRIVLSGTPSNYDNPSNIQAQLPFRASSTLHQTEQPSRRQQSATRSGESKMSNKNFIIIDRAELEELKKTFTSNEQPSPTIERNVPPSPDVVHIEFHSKLDDDRDQPLSFQTENRRIQSQQKPKVSSVHVDSNVEPIAEGSSPFSRIFEMNNDDIVSAGRRNSVERDVGPNHATIFRTSLVFDKYLKNDLDRLK